MASDRDAFLATIASHHEEDTPRLMYSYWLKEYGERHDKVRAQFIRLQIEAARSGAPLARLKADVFRARNRDALDGPLRDLGVIDCTWDRGFPLIVRMTLHRFLDNASTMIDAEPLIKSLDLDDRIGAAGAEALAASPHLQHLTDINLTGSSIGAVGAAVLAASPHLRNLTVLNFMGNAVGDAGSAALARSPYLRNLVGLNLMGNSIGIEGLQAIEASPYFSWVMYLDTELYQGPHCGLPDFFARNRLGTLLGVAD